MSQSTSSQWMDIGARSMASGNYKGARDAFEKAAATNPRSAIARHDLAIANVALGDIESAAVRLTEALRLKPDLQPAARRLDELLARGAVPVTARFDELGLKAALDYPIIDRDDLSSLALEHLATKPPLATLLEVGEREGWRAAALKSCLDKTDGALKNDLFKKALTTSFMSHRKLEYFLTALRRAALLDLSKTRFEDRSLFGFLIALAEQCRLNEYAWATSPDELAALDALDINASELAAGQSTEGLKLLQAMLYRPASAILGRMAPDDAKRLKPSMLRDAVVAHIQTDLDLGQRARSVRSLNAISDQTSLAVAAQYEHNPFPRWTSLVLPQNGETVLEALRRPFGDMRLSKMRSEPTEVLIAGCGTGLQAVKAAHCYGPKAKVTAIDLSTASLAYAMRMAEAFNATNIEFARADIRDLGHTPQFLGRFDIVECVGVLHHMNDPAEGLASISRCLKPSGMMLIALYSEIARREWTKLKSEPGYPGEDCGDDALRRYRQVILERATAESGPWSAKLRDLYTMSGFRDLFCHVKEHVFTLPEIDTALAREGLVFSGFSDPQEFSRLKRRFPDQTWPGQLHRWAELEAEQPNHFVGMYSFWCQKAAV